MSESWITFLSDYGLDDACVGVCHGVIARRAPQARVVDVCHAVCPQDVEHGATILAAAIGYLPVGVHLALVDPVTADGCARGVAVRTGDGSTFVAPDNGLASLAWPMVGGVVAAHELRAEEHWLPNPSPVFRGRDVYAPVAARLATGLPLPEVGPAVDPGGLVRLRLRGATVDDDHVHCEVLAVDHFGNLSLNVARSDLEAAGITLGDTVEVRMAGRTLRVPFTVSYGDVPPHRVAVCEDSLRRVMIAVNLGHAARTLRASRRDALVISRLPRAPAGSAGRRVGVDTSATRTAVRPG